MRQPSQPTGKYRRIVTRSAAASFAKFKNSTSG
jgi:hypothetical protein